MGLFDLIADLALEYIDQESGGKVSEGINTLREKIDNSSYGRQRDRLYRYQEEFQYKTDEELKNIYKNGSKERKLIAANELKNRGYGK
ncbi:hypothetical protein [Clostridium paraputrificum]|uniref:hypothetical protein n=1 Tax=Clostridium paraputrificum TaxID=29363 RepID=UPI00232B2880|nr:hypothetical protein [Clostridium paraputrificum]MDB2105856.1 hypothetical protein [Clostridium paraputrificum]MDB2112732.1 hypothetical protein [Clostridium paraputrificum]